MFPPEVLKTVSVYHRESDGDYPASADLTIEGAYLPMDRHAHTFEGGDYRDPHELYVEVGVDIREGDKLVIDSTNHYVKKVFVADFGGLSHKRCSVSKE